MKYAPNQSSEKTVSQSVSKKAHPNIGSSGLFQFVDARPEAAIQRQAQDLAQSSSQVQQVTQLIALTKSNTNTSQPVIQRVISYARGGFKDENALKAALYAIFPPKAHPRIDHWIKAYTEAPGRAQFASTIYKYIVEHHMPEEGFAPSFETTTKVDESAKHGPMLPDQVDRHHEADPQKALETFNFPSVTLGRATMMSGGDKISFQDRNINADFHAEDGLLEQVSAFIGKHPMNTTKVNFNLTINNFFCSHDSTGKSDKSHNCLDRIIALQHRYRFARFHVYFQNTYGTPEQMTAGIRALKAVGILVTSFSAKQDKAPYVHPDLDPGSDTEV